MHWEDIAESLRQELAGYGGILPRFEHQTGTLFGRELDKFPAGSPSIEELASALVDCRRERERRVAAFALEHGRAPDSPIRSLLDLIDADARPLLEALIDEVNCLLARVRIAGRQNPALLSRLPELYRELLTGQEMILAVDIPSALRAGK